MVKCQIAIYLDMDQLELLDAVKTQYHLKSISMSVETIIKQWQMFIDQRVKAQKLAPLANAPLANKYKQGTL